MEIGIEWDLDERELTFVERLLGSVNYGDFYETAGVGGSNSPSFRKGSIDLHILLTSFQLQQRILFKHCGLFAGGKVNGCLASFSRQRNSFASERVLMNRRWKRFRKLAVEDMGYSIWAFLAIAPKNSAYLPSRSYKIAISDGLRHFEPWPGDEEET
ncbi:hypothetical protein AVEN_154291-1 [Araneus ventricosus]|uniref:Uncharacterized protein n=1 Tax=Araneus ventricosus TaxID=182803 RepID=A0A4Y2NLY9_ARAVE|nr:hypothetical protein AVEN_154291-1 [Araneus ventricosus]